MEGADYTGSKSTAPGAPARRCVLVTGASRRVGAAIARRLAAGGARVAVHYHGAGGAAEALVAALGSSAGAFGADLSTAEGPAALLRAATAAGYSPDAIVHAAASFFKGTLAETSAGQWDAVMALNLRSLFLLARAYATERGELG